MLTSMSAFFKETTYTALKQIGLDRFSILGVSMGGMVGQMIALKYPDALEIIEQREMNGWTSTSQFLNLDQVKGRITSKNKAFFNSILMVNSGYFSGVTKVEYNNTTVIYKSFYKRKNRYVELYKREYGGLE